MLALLCLATILIGLSVLLLIGAPWFLFGKAAIADLPSRPTTKVAVGAFGSIAIAALVAPLGMMALISNSETVQHVSTNLNGLSFGI